MKNELRPHLEDAKLQLDIVKGNCIRDIQERYSQIKSSMNNDLEANEKLHVAFKKEMTIDLDAAKLRFKKDFDKHIDEITNVMKNLTIKLTSDCEEMKTSLQNIVVEAVDTIQTEKNNSIVSIGETVKNNQKRFNSQIVQTLNRQIQKEKNKFKNEMMKSISSKIRKGFKCFLKEQSTNSPIQQSATLIKQPPSITEAPTTSTGRISGRFHCAHEGCVVTMPDRSNLSKHQNICPRNPINIIRNQAKLEALPYIALGKGKHKCKRCGLICASIGSIKRHQNSKKKCLNLD